MYSNHYYNASMLKFFIILTSGNINVVNSVGLSTSLDMVDKNIKKCFLLINYAYMNSFSLSIV